MLIGLLGPAGTFSEEAARCWSRDADLKYFEDILDVVEAVETGDVDCGIVPLENSLEGSVNVTLDLIRDGRLSIVGEVVVKVCHCLLGLGELSRVRVAASHPQALSQCRNFIKKMGLRKKAVSSTAQAALLASHDESVAAIASRTAAGMYSLKVLASDIQDGLENFTRFAVLARWFALPSGRDKTSIVVFLEQNRPGALYEILEKFALGGIDLTRIESRPTREGLGEYLFFIDFRGHLAEPEVQQVLGEVKKKAKKLRVLGSYPEHRCLA